MESDVGGYDNVVAILYHGVDDMAKECTNMLTNKYNMWNGMFISDLRGYVLWINIILLISYKFTHYTNEIEYHSILYNMLLHRHII
jgi:uncharacterized protein YybS (DUF2232 family)